jgi:hypothetical protein
MSIDYWGWDRYERTYWTREDGRKRYIGHFRKNNDPYHLTTARISFWAAHPRKAMSHICQSGLDPMTFQNQTIN